MGNRIGFYNKFIEDMEGLERCEKIFDDYANLKIYIRKYDEIVLKSGLSTFGIETEELVQLETEYKLSIRIRDNVLTSFTSICNANDYVKSNAEGINKLTGYADNLDIAEVGIVREMLDRYTNSSSNCSSSTASGSEIDTSIIGDEVLLTAYKVDTETKKEFDKFCNNNRQYKKQDLVSLALLEFVNNHK